MYDNEIAKIARLQNGYELSIFDPTPSEEKAEKKAMEKLNPTPYYSGWRTFAFNSEEELFAFLREKLSSLNPRDFDEAYQAAFDAGVESEMPTKRGR